MGTHILFRWLNKSIGLMGFITAALFLAGCVPLTVEPGGEPFQGLQPRASQPVGRTTETPEPTDIPPGSTDADLQPGASQPVGRATETPGPSSIPFGIPDVDLSRSSVPIEEIYFDTFRPVNRAVPLSEAGNDLIVGLRDAIPPIHDPRFEREAQAGWMTPEEMVLGYASDQEAWAFPLRILNFHEIVNTSLAGTPVLISYCPLCYSGIVYSRELSGRELTFGNTSALYESDMVMLDYETGSYWWQVAGEAVVGELTGAALEVLPSSLMTWESWLEAFPETWVLSRDTGFGRNYEDDPFLGLDGYLNRGDFVFPVSEAALDHRLPPGERVIAVQVEDITRAYVINPSQAHVYNEDLGDQALVVFSDPAGPEAAVYSREHAGTVYTFSAAENGFIDQETGSSWNIAGKALEGLLAGAQLAGYPSKTSFWYAIVASEPALELIIETGK